MRHAVCQAPRPVYQLSSIGDAVVLNSMRADIASTASDARLTKQILQQYYILLTHAVSSEAHFRERPWTPIAARFVEHIHACTQTFHCTQHVKEHSRRLHKVTAHGPTPLCCSQRCGILLFTPWTLHQIRCEHVADRLSPLFPRAARASCRTWIRDCGWKSSRARIGSWCADRSAGGAQCWLRCSCPP